MDEAFKKSYEAAIDDVDVKNREVVAIISTDAVDREGDVLLPKGLRRKNYANLTVDYNHDKDKPLGVTKWVKSEPSRIIAKYRVSDKTEFTRDVFNLLQDGILRYHSVDGRGFASSKPTASEITLNKSWGDAKRIIRDWEMFNFCVCSVPVNPDAVALMVSKGYSSKTIESITGKPIGEITAASPAEIQVASNTRNLTSGEALVALSHAMTGGLDGMDVEAIIAKAFNRAAGRLG